MDINQFVVEMTTGFYEFIIYTMKKKTCYMLGEWFEIGENRLYNMTKDQKYHLIFIGRGGKPHGRGSASLYEGFFVPDGEVRIPCGTKPLYWSERVDVFFSEMLSCFLEMYIIKTERIRDKYVRVIGIEKKIWQNKNTLETV